VVRSAVGELVQATAREKYNGHLQFGGGSSVMSASSFCILQTGHTPQHIHFTTQRITFPIWSG